VSPIRKQVYELTVEDLARRPIWEFARDEEGLEGQDEATVRPYDSRGPSDMPEGMSVVRAKFRFADGTLAIGDLTPPCSEAEATDLGVLQPVVVTALGQVSFWYGTIAPKPKDVTSSYSTLGKHSRAQVFPLQFESDIPLAAGPVRGSISGFVVLEDWNLGGTSLVT